MMDWLGANLIRSTRIIDRGYRLYDRIRAELVLALASDTVLDRYNDLVYGATSAYRPGTAAFRHHLFPWEERAISEFFPAPPARVLVGGAGGGREVFALAARGYEVVAFEPCRALAEAMQVHAAPDMRVEVYRAGYTDLPILSAVSPAAAASNLDTVGPFDAAIIGWGSFPHLRSEASRVETLKAFARATCGPILASFFSRPEMVGPPTRRERFRRHLPRRLQRDLGDAFGIAIGVYHQFTMSEISSLALKAGLAVSYLSSINDGDSWPHAVFMGQTHQSRPMDLCEPAAAS